MTDQGDVVHIGGYTRESDGTGDGIVAARRDPETGALTPLGTVAVTASPSFLVRHPTLPVLYAVNELPEGQVSAWRIGPDGDLTPLGTGDTGGAEPCHLAVTPDGRHLVAANYGGGSVAVFPLDGAGAPAGRSDLVVHSGHGPDPERQEKAHAHMVSPDPDGGPLYVVDLGADAVYGYDLDAVTGRLTPRTPEMRTQPGTGPRHLARHPDGRRVYLVGELDGAVTALARDAEGALRQQGRVPASGRTGHVQPSEIAVGPQGRFLYVANRGVGTLAVFAIDGELPELVAEVDTGGEWPRHFAWSGRDLYLADQRADMVRAFRVDPATGVPEPAGEPVPVPSPSCVLL
ncbi:3-carboxymuconate cyclase [Micromonospora echinospora]|uniref:6-phosphogluconolactonase, cycloisomerase 2 family n=1 Tax=Micromonospora echinospora TaxID=1877 RepID=A0A1C4XRF2_MICEC|nr:lactonase family protein [Micromonospora echinospora]OZV78493.1 3-carboxymuconate cyclase [Micromonospora echinospora]SCF11089.1 6-phosphogluconolactonase, cycloisomerase 2 family [Micromonospora echinospora]